MIQHFERKPAALAPRPRDTMPDPAIPDRPRSRSLKPLRALLPFLRPYRGTLLLALGALLVAAAAMLALPVALRYLIDEGMAARSPETINRYFIALAAAEPTACCRPALLPRHLARNESSPTCARRCTGGDPHGRASGHAHRRCCRD
jgi:hypothetical protein